MPWAAASFLKSASQRSKLPVLRQLAFWAQAGGPAMRAAITAQAKAVHSRTLGRIGLSAVVDDIVTAEGRACKPSLLILPQLAYPDRGWPVQIIIRAFDRMMTPQLSGTRRMGDRYANCCLDDLGDRGGPLAPRLRAGPTARGALRAAGRAAGAAAAGIRPSGQQRAGQDGGRRRH